MGINQKEKTPRVGFVLRAAGAAAPGRGIFLPFAHRTGVRVSLTFPRSARRKIPFSSYPDFAWTTVRIGGKIQLLNAIAVFLFCSPKKKNSPGRIRTYDQVINSHLRYHCATGECVWVLIKSYQTKKSWSTRWVQEKNRYYGPMKLPKEVGPEPAGKVAVTRLVALLITQTLSAPLLAT